MVTSEDFNAHVNVQEIVDKLYEVIRKLYNTAFDLQANPTEQTYSATVEFLKDWTENQKKYRDIGYAHADN